MARKAAPEINSAATPKGQLVIQKGELMRMHFVIVPMLIASSAQAQMYQCVKDGKTAYQDAPCAPSSKVSRTIAGNAAASQMVLWDDLKYGMSVDQIRQKIPNTKPGTGSRIVSGAEALLRVEHVAIAGTYLDAEYFFAAGKFAQVNLTDPMMNNNEVNLRNFDRVSAEFRAKYGKEVVRNVKNENFGLSADAEWSGRNAKIWAGISPVTAATSRLILGYKPSDTSGR